MGCRLRHIFVFVAGILVVATAALGHHGYAAYDMSKTESSKATIVELVLENPHSRLSFDVKGADGSVEHYFSEAGGPRTMRQDGFTPDSIKAGDEGTVYYHPAKNGAHVVVLVKIELADGRVLTATGIH